MNALVQALLVRCASAALDDRATRFLARAAFDAGAVDPVSFEFLLDSPERAEEVLEFSRWLSGPEEKRDSEGLQESEESL